MKKKTKLLIGTALICPLLLALILVVALVVVPHFTNKFRIDVVDDISLGASKVEVRTKLGDPYLEEKTRWGYGDKKLCSYLEDAQDISAAMEEAILRGDLERVERLNRQYENLMNEVASKKFSYIEVNFEDDAVVSVLLDKAYALEPGFKKVEEDKLTYTGDGSRVVLPYYIDYTQNPEGEMRQLDCELGEGVAYSGKELSCATKFTDGSYFYTYVKSYEVENDNIVWADDYSDHKKRKPYGFSAPTSPLGTISADGTWSSNINFKSITLPANVTSIGSEAFRDCSELESIEIPDNVTSIGESAFRGCTGLTNITIPDSVTSIGEEAFFECSGLEHIIVEEGNPVYRSETDCLIEISTKTVILGCKNSVIPDSVTSIGEDAFYNCSGLTSVTIGSGVTSIGSSAFRGCSGLTSITIPDSVTSIGYDAFSGTAYYNDNSHWENGTVLYIGDYLIKAKSSILGDYSIHDNTKVIADGAFSDCNGLKSITIPDSVTEIGGSAFSGCDKIESATMPTLAISYIPRTSLTTVVLTSGDSIRKYAFCDCDGLESVTIGSGVTSIGVDAFYGCDGLTSVTIGSGVTSIGSEAFRDCSELESIEIPDSVTSIGDWAFWGCSGLKSVTIGSGVTSIGNGAFSGCSGLKSIIIPDSVTSIGDRAFANCYYLTSATIGDGVTSIGASAFANCYYLTSVTIGNGVTSIGYGAFRYCDWLETDYYKGTAEEWGNISIDNDYNSNDYLLNATRYYFTEDKPTAEEWAEWDYWWHYDPVTNKPTPWVK